MLLIDIDFEGVTWLGFTCDIEMRSYANTYSQPQHIVTRKQIENISKCTQSLTESCQHTKLKEINVYCIAVITPFCVFLPFSLSTKPLLHDILMKTALTAAGIEILNSD